MLLADKIICNASFFPGLGLDDDLDFVTIRGNKIQSIGKGDGWREFAGDDTQVITLTKDQLVIPGFHDAHLHALMSALNFRYVDLGDAKNEEEAAQLVFEFAKTIPDEEWVFGLNWYHLNWNNHELPTKRSLDGLFPDRPVFLINTEVHGAWVNSEALRRAGITDDTEDPPYGEIYRFDSGEVTGFLNEKAMGLVARIAFKFPVKLEQSLLMPLFEYYAKEGITAVQDLRPELGYDLGQYEALQAMEQEGTLNLRVFSAANLFDSVETVLADAEKYNGELFQICLLKQFVDGVPTTHTAMTTEPYLDNPSTTGDPINDIAQMRASILNAHKNGLSVKLHCCGDRAVETALDMYEEAVEKYGFTKSRHAVEHVEILRPQDVERFRKLKVIASMQPEHLVAQVAAYKDYPYRLQYSEATLKNSWIFRTLIDAGVTVAFGSDNPVVQVRPLSGVYRAVTRKFDDGLPEAGINPSEKISVGEALHCYTRNPAYAVGREGEVGTLEPGKLADIAVLDRNILKTNPEEIKDTKVLLTMMNGRITHDGVTKGWDS